MFMSSPSEVTKFTMSSDLARQIADCSGELFIPRDMPEAPKQSFLREVSSILIGGIVGAPKQEVVNFNELCEIFVVSNSAAGI
jgi:syntaxin-binding protein 5